MHSFGLNETPTRNQGTTRPADSGGMIPGVEIRDLEYGDLAAAVSIERRSFSSPWTIGMFALEMTKPDTVALAATIEDQLTSYLVLSRYDLAWHLMNIAVDPGHRRLGLATLLIGSVFARVGYEEPVTLEVRPSNHSAIELYERLGFRSFGLRKAYYPDNGEDAVIMWKGDPSLAGVPVT